MWEQLKCPLINDIFNISEVSLILGFHIFGIIWYAAFSYWLFSPCFFLAWKLIHLFIYFVVKSLSCVQLFVTPWTVACQAPLSMGFPRQEYQSGLPFPSPRDLPDPGIKPTSPALADGFFTAESPGKRMSLFLRVCCNLAPRTSVFWSSFQCNTSKVSTYYEHCPGEWERHRGQDLCGPSKVQKE